MPTIIENSIARTYLKPQGSETAIFGYLHNGTFYATKEGSSYLNPITPKEGVEYIDMEGRKIYVWSETDGFIPVGGESSYNSLVNKPKINGVTLEGNKTTQELHIEISSAETYDDYESAVAAINAWPADYRSVSGNVFIRTLDVPDLWISEVEQISAPYTYTTDAAIVSALKTDGYVRIGYYKLSALETQKVDLSDYYTKSEIDTMIGDVESALNEI